MKTGAGNVFVLDAWAVLAYLNNEPAAQQVRQVLRRARSRQTVVFLSLINLGECLYVIERTRGVGEAAEIANRIDQLAVQIVTADRTLVFEAAHLKARYPISYADAFAAALAKQHHARLMTGDPEFKAVAEEIDVHWLPTRGR